MFATTAHAQTPAGAPAGGPPGGGPLDLMGPFLLPIALLALFWFMVLRPQQQRAKAIQAQIGKAKRGDTVVLSSGFVGKVQRVEDTELQVEIAPAVVVRVLKSAVSEVRTKGEPLPANDAKG